MGSARRSPTNMAATRPGSGRRPRTPRTCRSASQRSPVSELPRHGSWSGLSASTSVSGRTDGRASPPTGRHSPTSGPWRSERRTRRRSAPSKPRCAPKPPRKPTPPRRQRRHPGSGRPRRWRVAGAEVTVFEDGGVRIVMIGPMGPYGNNAYVVRDVAAGAALLVDMPLDEGPLLEAIAAEGGVQTVIATHWHPDHWMTYDAVRAATGAPVLVGSSEVRIPEERIDGRLDDGAEVTVGSARIGVIHTPGHTPGSISLRIGRAVITGDTLFGGGPGKTSARGDLETIMASITAKLLPLPEETPVPRGHGTPTTIAASRSGVAAYQRHPQPAGYYGDVEWGD